MKLAKRAGMKRAKVALARNSRHPARMLADASKFIARKRAVVFA